jgi:hypothetical protein
MYENNFLASKPLMFKFCFVLLQPYAELKDSNGRPDLVVAAEAWDNHIIRDKETIKYRIQ